MSHGQGTFFINGAADFCSVPEYRRVMFSSQKVTGKRNFKVNVIAQCNTSQQPNTQTKNNREKAPPLQVASTGWKVELTLLSNRTGVNRKYLSHRNTSFWFKVYDKDILKTYGIHPPSDVSTILMFSNVLGLLKHVINCDCSHFSILGMTSCTG